jgi:hypothetical protein
MPYTGDGETDCRDEVRATRPGPILKTVAGVCMFVPLAVFALCVAAMLLCLGSLLTGLFGL